MTPTCDEETELARVMCGNKPREWQDKLVHDHDPMAPLETDGERPMKPRWMRFVGLARLALAAGYRKQDPAAIRNQALEAAAKSCDALVHEASANRAAESTNYDFWQGAAVGAEESAARIRALKT